MYPTILLHCGKPSFCLVLALIVQTLGGGSVPNVSAQTPTEQDVIAERALDESAALLEQGTEESLRSAVVKLKTAVSLFRKTGNQPKEATSLFGLGRINTLLYEYQIALEYFNEALPLYVALANKTGEARTLNHIGRMYKSIGEYQTALEYYRRALPVFKEIGHPDEESTTLSDIGVVYDDLGQYEKALAYYNDALRIDRARGYRKQEATMLNNIGLVFFRIGEYARALEYYSQALQIRRSAGDKLGEGATLHNIGAVQESLGNIQKALDYNKQALSLNRVAGDREGEAATLNSLGTSYQVIGESKQALDYYNLALTIFRAVRDKGGEAAALDNIGLVYDSLGEMQKALYYYELALPLMRAAENKGGEARILSNIGAAYDYIGQKEKALDYYNQAIPLLKAVKDKGGESMALNNVGFLYYWLGEYKKAFDNYKEALELATVTGDKDSQAKTLNNIGALNGTIGQVQSALSYSSKALLLFRTVGDREGEAKALTTLMSVYHDAKNPQLAVFFGKQAVNGYQKRRRAAQDVGKESQRIYLQTVADAYRDLADLLIEQGRLAEGQIVLELLKDEEYFEFVRRDKDEIDALGKSLELNQVERKAFSEYARLADKLTAIGAKYQVLFDKRGKLGGRSLLDPIEEAEFQKFSRELATTSETFQKFLASLAAEFAKSKPIAKFQIARIEELQSDLREVGPDVALVATFVLPDRYRVILTTGQTQIDHKVEIKAEVLNRKLNCFLMALKNPRIDPRPVGKELFDILVKPLEQDLKNGDIKTILWSLDGGLRYIPVSALWDGEHYLAERYQNTIITLGRNSRLFREVNRDWRALGAGVSAKWPGFQELPAVKKELRAVVRDEKVPTETEGVLPGQRLLDAEFIIGRLRDLMPSQENGRRFNVIHLASHFKLHQTRELSFLLLGDGSELSLTEFDKDPRLKMSGVELLTLSACDTAVGIDKGDGSEFESFGMLAEKNGAKAVMATLWEVADCSTGEFMRQFYRSYQQGQQTEMTKAAALQQAQRAMLNGAIQAPAECEMRTGGTYATTDVCALPAFTRDPAKPLAHPYYWAPFVLFGNWR
jgi:CHAT domain-containing protein/tetratricopeptide (TPR) repeat protein